MAHPNIQISANSPKKTPQSTPSKAAAQTNPSGENNVEGTVTSGDPAVTTATTGSSIPNLQLPQMTPVTQKFGCLRICRLSSLLLSTHC